MRKTSKTLVAPRDGRGGLGSLARLYSLKYVSLGLSMLLSDS